MNNIIEVKYPVGNNSVHAIEPTKATSGYTGCDFFATKEKILFRRCVTLVTIELKIETPLVILEKSIPDQPF